MLYTSVDIAPSIAFPQALLKTNGEEGGMHPETVGGAP